MGAVVGHKRVFAEKTLLALLKKHDIELRHANAGAGGTTVNINIGKSGMEVDANGTITNPQCSFSPEVPIKVICDARIGMRLMVVVVGWGHCGPNLISGAELRLFPG